MAELTTRSQMIYFIVEQVFICEGGSAFAAG